MEGAKWISIGKKRMCMECDHVYNSKQSYFNHLKLRCKKNRLKKLDGEETGKRIELVREELVDKFTMLSTVPRNQAKAIEQGVEDVEAVKLLAAIDLILKHTGAAHPFDCIKSYIILHIADRKTPKTGS